MNHPDVYDKFVVPAHLRKVAHRPDTKISNAATFEIQREDHTVGDPLVMQLLDDPKISFAAYKIPHPMEHRLELKVRTSGSITPVLAYNNALAALRLELQDIQEQFKRQVQDAFASHPTQPDFEPHEQYEGMQQDGYEGYTDEGYMGDGAREGANLDFGNAMEFSDQYGAA